MDATALGTCFDVHTEKIGRFDLGFDLEASRAAKEVRGVRAGSAAERAGLKDGQRMTSLSIAYGDPTRDIEVGVRDAGADAKLTWTPQGDPIDVPQVAPRDASSDCGGP